MPAYALKDLPFVVEENATEAEPTTKDLVAELLTAEREMGRALERLVVVREQLLRKEGSPQRVIEGLGFQAREVEAALLTIRTQRLVLSSELGK